jgi:hypothetical protein
LILHDLYGLFFAELLSGGNMENRTDFENNPQVDPTIVEEVLRDINTLQNEKNFEIDLEKQKNILHDKLTNEEAKILVDQQDYIDYLNPKRLVLREWPHSLSI